MSYSMKDDNGPMLGKPWIDYKKLSRPLTEQEREELRAEIRQSKGRSGYKPPRSYWEDDTPETIAAGE